MSVQLPFRLSFPHSQMLPLSSDSFSDSRVHLSSSVSKKRWHQSPASPAFLFIPLLFVNTACVVFGAISPHWMRNILVCFPLHFSSSYYRYFSYKNQTEFFKLNEFYPTCILPAGWVTTLNTHSSYQKHTCGHHWHARAVIDPLICYFFPDTSRSIWERPIPNMNGLFKCEYTLNSGQSITTIIMIIGNKFCRHWFDIAESRK